MKDMKFTIIVPVYNVVSYIDRCVHSVVIQDYANWELLLIDDGSTDGSGEKCDVWSGRDNRVITIHKANGGVSSARNAGLEKASGDYITFIDADDYWETSGVLSEAANHVPCDVIYMKNIIIRYPSGDKKIVSRGDLFPDSFYEGDIYSYFSKRLKNGSWGCYYFFFLSSVIKADHIFFDETIKIGEDADWIFRACDVASTVGFIDFPYYNYCVNRNDSAMMIKSTASLLTLFRWVDKWKRMTENDYDRYHDVFVSVCNNVVRYLPVFALHGKEERRALTEGFLRCGALDYAESKKAVKAKKWISRLGIDAYVRIAGVRYRFRLMGRDAKAMVMRYLPSK
jgi:Glycosyltransferases involved in cell wall biogenesis